jgi:hypothetical protein
MTFAQTVIVTLTPVECAHCGCHFGIDEAMRQRRVADHERFYCPSGHSNVYRGESEANRLKREKKKLEDDLWFAENKARNDKLRLAAQKGQFTKYRNRIAKGICPCCNLTFPDVAQHMASQHASESSTEPPEYSSPQESDDKPLQQDDKITWRGRPGLFVRHAKNTKKTKMAVILIDGYASAAYKPLGEVKRVA